jgi:hypothetical protein
MNIEILHTRDPDMGCEISIYIDGALAEEGGTIPFNAGTTVHIREESIDPGAGYSRTDWDDRIESVSTNATLSDAFKADVLAALTQNADSQYIDG